MSPGKGTRPWYEIPEAARVTIRFLGGLAGSVWEIAVDHGRYPAVLGFVGLLLLYPEAAKAQRRRREQERKDEEESTLQRIAHEWIDWDE